MALPHRRRDPRRQPARARRDARVRRSGRKLSRRARRAVRRARPPARSSSAGRKAARRTWPRPTASSPAGPGIAFVTRGPGASNAAVGIHTAAQDSTPMILLRRPGRQRHASTARRSRRSTTGGCTAASPSGRRRSIAPSAFPNTSRTPIASRCRAGPGPSCSRCPRTCWRRAPTCADAPRVDADRRRAATPHVRRRRARAARATRARPLVHRRRQPLGRRRPCAALRALRRSAPDCRSPARSATRTSSTTAIRTTPATSASASIPKLAARVREADVLLVIGERLGEMTTSGYTLLDAPLPRADADPRASRAPRSSAASTSRRSRSTRRRGEFLEALGATLPLRAGRRGERSLRARTPTTRHGARRAPVPGDVDLWQIVRWLDERLPDDAIVTNGAGNYATWMHRLFRYRALSHAARAVLGLDGLRRAGGGRRQGRASASASSCPGTATAAS